MRYVVKAAPPKGRRTRIVSFSEKTMWKGKTIDVGDEVFIFESDHEGGRGLIGKGSVLAVRRGPASRVSIRVRRTSTSKRRLGRPELRPYRECVDDRPQTEIARRLYRQATNKIAGISDRAAAFLNSYF